MKILCLLMVFVNLVLLGVAGYRLMTSTPVEPKRSITVPSMPEYSPAATDEEIEVDFSDEEAAEEASEEEMGTVFRRPGGRPDAEDEAIEGMEGVRMGIGVSGQDKGEDEDSSYEDLDQQSEDFDDAKGRIRNRF